MTDESIFTGLRSIADALRAASRPFALVGGLAVSVRGEPRFTRDVDVVVMVLDDREMETEAASGPERCGEAGLGEPNDLEAVRANLGLIVSRGFDRGEDLASKLDSVLTAARE